MGQARQCLPLSFMLPFHSAQRNELDRLYAAGVRCFLLLGDVGIGKRTLVQQWCLETGLMVRRYERFQIDDARELKQDCQRRYTYSRAYCIDGDAGKMGAFNAILKLLEEPPDGCYFFICSTVAPITTISSRSAIIRIPRLTQDEVLQGLRFKGMSDKVAISVAPYSGGSISEAFKIYERMESKKALIKYIVLLLGGSIEKIMVACKDFKQEELNLLRDLVVDLQMSRYGLKYPELTYDLNLSVSFLDKVKEALLAGRSPQICLMRAYFQTRQ